MTQKAAEDTAPRCAAPRCGRSGDARLAVPGTRLCPICQQRLDGHLAGLPRQYARAAGMLTSAHRRGERVRGTGTPGIPLHFAAVEARAALESLLSCWAQLVVDERQVAAPRRVVADMAAFLRLHQNWLVAHPAAGDLVEEVGAVYRRFQSMLETVEPRQVALGPCPAAECTGVLTAALRSAGGGGEGSDVRCSYDADHYWPVQSWGLLRRLGQRVGSAV